VKLPFGYRYAAAYAGIRSHQEDDIALIVPDTAAQAAAVFTINVVQAAPVRIAKRHLKSSNGKVAAVLVNAGNANCATRSGERVALTCCKAVAKALKTRSEYVLPASTGVIGIELDSKLLTAAIPNLIARLSPDSFEAAACAIMTTDTTMKVASEETRLSGGTMRIAGMTKGAGMIHPNMATTLGFVMTDAAIAPKYLHEMLRVSVDRTYCSLTVDGDMSTNDMVVLLANGASGVKPSEKECHTVQELITCVMESLARQIAADGEGARKLIVVHALGFKAEDQARKVARSVANSLLVKTAITGNDPNWGRILAAAGYSGVRFDPSDVNIDLQDVPVCYHGVAARFDEAALKGKLNQREVRIRVLLNGEGKAEARIFTCDLTEDYIKINASYRT
jgi:glutamate N-acetyltransferase / amino-acid N-acetyltransferase